MRVAQQYRANADECQHIADTAALDYVRVRFRELADHWRRLADEAEHSQKLPK
jgi:hypothetical protein